MTIGSIITLAIAALVAITVAFIYFNIVRQQLHIANVAVDKPTEVANARGFIATLDAKLSGWKTVILAWIAGVAQLLQALPSMLSTDALSAWQQLPWANVLDAKVANWITIVCALLIPIVHAKGVAYAATTTPVEPGA